MPIRIRRDRDIHDMDGGWFRARWHYSFTRYLYVIEGDVTVNGERMETGGATQITDEPRIEIRATADSELILVDVGLS